MKKYDIGEFLAEFVFSEETKNDEEILVTIDGIKICTITPRFEMEDVSFKVKKTHC